MKLTQLEALRGAAALYVVIYHSSNFDWTAQFPLGNLLRLGQEVVMIFFLMSGFVIHYSFQRGSNKTFRTYFLRRFLRVYAPLLPILLLSYLVASWQAGSWIDPQWRELLGNLLMLQDNSGQKPGVIVDPYLYNLPLWTLSYEWWFWMLYYPTVRLLPEWRRRAWVVFGFSAVIGLLYMVAPNALTRLFLYFGLWWIGAYLADLYLRGTLHRFEEWAPLLAYSGGMAVLMCLNMFWIQQRTGETMVFWLGYPVLEARHFAGVTCLLIAAYLWKRVRWFGFDALLGRFAILAPISYSVYASHFFLYTEAHYLDFIANYWLRTAAYLSVVVAVSWLIEMKLFPLVNRAALDWERGLSGSPKAKLAA